MEQQLGRLAGRIAGAPISWGVCEVPGWGVMLSAERVLTELRSVGLTATELGAPGFLPTVADDVLDVLRRNGVSLVGGFVALVLHRAAERRAALRQAEEIAGLFAACGATRFVTAAVEDAQWSRPRPLDASGMRELGRGLEEVDAICAAHGLVQVLHPHVDTVVETAADVALALEHTDVRWCLDTGHLRIGGVDPVLFARQAGERVAHVHLKDVDGTLADRVGRRQLSLLEGVRRGLFRPLGAGDIAIGEVVTALEERGYDGWYVIEQDVALDEPVPAPGDGPVKDVRACVDFLTDLAAELPVAAYGARA